MLVGTLLVTALLCWALAPVVRRWPAVLYGLCLVAVGVFWVVSFQGLPKGAAAAPFLLMRYCAVPVSLFAVVMFTGALPEGSALRRRMVSARAEYSIAACLLVLGHVGVYGVHYLIQLVGAGAFRLSVALIFAFGVIITLFMLVLGITSFAVVKRRMSAQSWQRLQKTSYLFWALVYCHVLMVFAGPALAGSATAAQSLALYTVLFAVYAIARIVHARAS